MDLLDACARIACISYAETDVCALLPLIGARAHGYFNYDDVSSLDICGGDRVRQAGSSQG